VAKTAEPLHVLIDTREQRPWAFSRDVTSEFVTLDSGDYSIRNFSDRVRVERKSLADLVGSITVGRDRFLDECRRLTAFEFRLLVVEASVEAVLAHAYRSQTNPQSVLGSVIALHVDFGLPCIWAGDARNAANMVERIFRRIVAKSEERAA
jgi:DNA excision repair protein ERCC-4